MRTVACAVAAATLILLSALSLGAHDFSKNPVTWNREMSRLVYDRCASCHREGGTSFSLMTYQDAQPRAIAIREAVLSRRMPPWGAVKGFGDFRNDQGLTQEQVELVAGWVEGGMSKGNNPNALPPPPRFTPQPAFRAPADKVRVRGPFTLRQSMTLDGVLPDKVPAGSSLQITALLPSGAVLPLVWLYEYRSAHQHPFLFRKPLDLPGGTTIRGVQPPASIFLLPATSDGER
ncbi:MAG TPA: cytochrome c [Vicinamibacterales bacterium]|nr:cytochrome c [Vicinamibacterales bacterium]